MVSARFFPLPHRCSQYRQHGVKRVQNSEAVLEARKQPDQAKLKEYLALYDQIFEKVHVFNIIVEHFKTQAMRVEKELGIQFGCACLYNDYPAYASGAVHNLELPKEYLDAGNISRQVCLIHPSSFSKLMNTQRAFGSQ